MQFLVRKTHHTTGEVFFDVTRAKENETFTVVEAESREDALNNIDISNSRYGNFEIISIFIAAIGALSSGIFYTFKFLL
ncbi:DUF1381 domain-containing protein [Staphylococcus saprophyticus]|uniref:DUF1381 domain-containing protein n=1 Tax=Staphylococcus saprophyticus TaxID=29385 RepID=UPI002DB96D0A|nr:DUF1381 domain-containing protein [Staphylococcus saprophyticus]